MALSNIRADGKAALVDMTFLKILTLKLMNFNSAMYFATIEIFKFVVN